MDAGSRFERESQAAEACMLPLHYPAKYRLGTMMITGLTEETKIRADRQQVFGNLMQGALIRQAKLSIIHK